MADDSDVLGPDMRRLGDVTVSPHEDHALRQLQERMFGQRTPTRVGRYRLERQLGAGAMGVVFVAHDPELDRRVAIKLIKPGSGRGRAELSARLHREARAMARLRDPNVVEVYDVGDSDGWTYVAMELIDGEPLSAWLGRGGHGWREVLELFLAAGRGLAAAHAHDLLHRDFKPENVLVARDGRVCVGDFGLARPLVPSRDGASGRAPDVPLGDDLTRSGALVGTPAYMAPEAFTGTSPDAKADQFSFCASLFEGLYGVRPFRGRTVSELWLAISEGQLAPTSRRIPGALHRAVRRGLEPEPQERWPSMEALLHALQRVARAGRRRTLGAGIALGVGACGAILWLAADGSAAGSCADAADELGALWRTQRDEVARRFDESELVYARESWDRVEPMLADRIDAWRAARTRACEAEGEGVDLLDERIHCLQTREAEVRSLLDVLATAEDSVVERAVDATSSLPPVARCEDPTWLRAVVRPPDDPELREQVARVRRVVADAHANIRLGRFELARSMLRDVTGNSGDLGYAPLHVEVGLAMAEASQHDKPAERARMLREVYFDAVGADYDPMAAAAAAGMAGALADDGRADEARTWVAHGLAALDRQGADPGIRVRLLGALVTAERAAGEPGAALEAAQTALALARDTPLTDLDVAECLINVGTAHHDLRRFEDALGIFEEAYEIRREALGDDHPDVAHALHSAGAAAWNLGQLDKAQRYHETALAVRRRVFGDEHYVTAYSLRALANVHWKAQRLQEAARLHRQALAALEAHYGPGHMRTAQTLNDLGATLFAMGELDEAKDFYTRAIEVREAALGPAHAQLLVPLKNLAEVYVEQGEIDPALAYFRRSLAIGEAEYGPDEPGLSFILTGMGHALRLDGQLDEAIHTLERAVALAEAGAPAQDVDAPRTELEKARAVARR